MYWYGCPRVLPSSPTRRSSGSARRDREVSGRKGYRIIARSRDRASVNRIRANSGCRRRRGQQGPRQGVTINKTVTPKRPGQGRIGITVLAALIVRRHRDVARRDRQVSGRKARNIVIGRGRECALVNRIRPSAGYRRRRGRQGPRQGVTINKTTTPNRPGQGRIGIAVFAALV
ncbi:MAG: hypothetical protein AN485_23985, partial [Anabaena sp. MDT14b]